MFDVMKERCDQCLFTQGRIVSNKRAAEVLMDCRRRDAHFICHKATLAGNKDVCCRGFYDRNPEATNLMRIAHRLNAVRFLAPAQLKKAKARRAEEERGRG